MSHIKTAVWLWRFDSKHTNFKSAKIFNANFWANWQNLRMPNNPILWYTTCIGKLHFVCTSCLLITKIITDDGFTLQGTTALSLNDICPLEFQLTIKFSQICKYVFQMHAILWSNTKSTLWYFQCYEVLNFV